MSAGAQRGGEAGDEDGHAKVAAFGGICGCHRFVPCPPQSVMKP